MNPIVVYHYPCQDGFTAAWVVRHKHAAGFKVPYPFAKEGL